MFKIEVNKAQLNHIFGCLAKLKALAIGFQESIPEESSREFATLLKTNLIGQKYASMYPPLGTWKKGEPGASKFWLWYGDALASIKHQKIQTGTWFAGFVDSSGAGSVNTQVRQKTKKVVSSAVKRVGGKLVPTSSKEDRAKLLRQSVERRRRSIEKEIHVKIYTKQEIADYVRRKAEEASRMPETRVIDFGKPHKSIRRQHN